MKSSYAVKWRESSGRLFLGSLDFRPTAFVLEGREGTEDAVVRLISFQRLMGVRLAHSPGERIDGKPTLVVERAGGDVLVTTAVVHAGLLQELVHRLSERRLAALPAALEGVPLADETSS